ncbi:MAG: D-2-hydroxyacid dehydrogenase [Acinetobacter sp.]
MTPLKITCTEKYVLIDHPFKFDFPVEYTEYQQLSQEQLYQQVFDQDVIIISDLIIDEQVLQNNPNLKLLALCSTGYNHVNIDLLHQHGVQVCNIRGYAGDAVAEHAFALMIQLIKNFSQQVEGVKQGKWTTGQSSFYLAAPMRELKGKTLTILGKGEIGESLAQKAQAFGMHVIFSERKNAENCREGYVPFEQAIQQADILSLHCELNESTHHLIDASVLSQMKPESILINVGRGGLVKDTDLTQALQKQQLSGFGADVLDQEPPAADHPLLLLQQQHPNVLITGHIAWGTDEAQQRLFDILQDNINKNMQGIQQNLV